MPNSEPNYTSSPQLSIVLFNMLIPFNGRHNVVLGMGKHTCVCVCKNFSN